MAAMAARRLDEATIAAAEYLISRYLYIYPNATRADAEPAVQAFVDFYLSDGIAEVSDAGYVPLGEADLRPAGRPGRPLTASAIPSPLRASASGRPALPIHQVRP